jgi:hypothetical protein
MNYAEVADSLPAQQSLQVLDDALTALEIDLSSEEQANFSSIITRVNATTDFFTAPASAKFHLNEEYGLYKHSLGVTYRLCALDAAYNIFEECGRFEGVLCGLLHDLGKAGQVTLTALPVETVKISNDDTVSSLGKRMYKVEHSQYYVKRALKTKPGEYEYRRNPERIGMSIPLSSLHFIGTMLGDYWKPSPAAWAAVAYHDGMYVPEGQNVAHADTKLGVALHQADYFQCRVEAEWSVGSGWHS